MSLQSVRIEHLPAVYTVHLALFRGVENAETLHRQLLQRNAEFEYGFVDASVLLSRRHLLSAVFKAINALSRGNLKTPNVHSEIVACLSASGNIADAYRRFGISPSTKNLAIVKVVADNASNPAPLTGEAIWQHLHHNVQGEALDLTDDNLGQSTNLDKIQKSYKLGNLCWLQEMKDVQRKRDELEMLVLSSIASQGV